MHFPKAGQTFQGKYELLNVLGRGGFAAVYRATDLEIGREVAIKMLVPSEDGYDSSTVARFLREARVVAQLRDPHTITMFDFGRTDDGLLYMVFEYVAGRDLSQILKQRGNLPPETALHVLDQLLQALREAHQAGVLHRDIKPANVLIYSYMDDDWRVKLLDFGIAKPGIGEDADPVATLTRTGGIIGTPRYMSPEQLCGEELNATTDIYSLGLVAFEMLVGTPAIDGRDTKDNLLLQLSEAPLLFPQTSMVPAHIRAIVERMMARDAEGRFQSAAEVQNTLRAAASGALATRHTPPSRTVPPEYRTGPGQAVGPGPRTTHRAEMIRPPSRVRLDELGPTTLLAIGVGLGAVVVAAGLLLARGTAPSGPVLPAPADSTPRNPLAAIVEPVETPKKAVPEEPPPPPLNIDPCQNGPPPEMAYISGATFGLAARSWLTHVPKGYAKGTAYPLMLLLHDRTRDPDRALRDTEMGRLADEHGFVVVAPKGADYNLPWDPATDPDLINEIVARTRESLCIDPQRFYAVGHNLGAAAVEALACQIQFSAIATTAYRGDELECEYKPPVPHIHFVGDNDKYQPIEGGRTCEGMSVVPLEKKETAWFKNNDCTGAETTYLKLPSGKCRTKSCEAPFVSCQMRGGRDWPGSAARGFQLPGCNNKPGSFPIADTVWEFFEKHGRLLETGE